jgi:predicted dehydrogenase/threonine dehydrogenase-like Zn-dependent dehydrogenase
MKQIIQNYKTGELQLVEVPSPAVKKGFVLVGNVNSLVSVGTEKTMLEMAKRSLLGKALARPDLVKQVIAKVKSEGIMEAYKASMARLDNPVPLGYSCAGTVLDCGNVVECILKIGDKVSCGGVGYASHAEIVSVPENMCVKIPEAVDLESASFVALGGIALEAVRMAKPSLGDKVAVIGLGLLGQITIQLLRVAGCHVFGIDISEAKIAMALAHGAEKGAISDAAVTSAITFAPEGFDSVIIMAAAKNNQPLELAAGIARERGKIVAAGLIGLEIPRKIFFEKELDFVVSRAWGPGVFDPEYNEKGLDYPYAYARWTAKRNLEEFLSQLSKGTVKVDHLISHRFPIEQALDAYDLILKGKEAYLGVLISYGGIEREQKDWKNNKVFLGVQTQTTLKPDNLNKLNQPDERNKPNERVSIGLIGAGLFARGTLLPAIKGVEGISFRGIATRTGLSGNHIGKKFGFTYSTTDASEVLKDPEVNLVMVLTRHGSHAKWVCEALKAGKNVFVEKPLCMNEEQLSEIVKTYSELETLNSELPLLMVGFNRRFAPTTREAIRLFSNISRPLIVTIRVNIGPVRKDSWIHDPEEGGGNVVGEVCHFVDLIQAVTGSSPVKVFAQAAHAEREGQHPEDSVVINLSMANGSIADIVYTTLGDKSFEREKVEIFGGGAACVIENFKSMRWSHGGKKKRIGGVFSGVDRGHRDEMRTIVDCLRQGKLFPVSFESYVATTRTTFAAVESLRTGKPVEIILPRRRRIR